MSYALVRLLHLSFGLPSAFAGALSAHTACLGEMSRHITSETVNRVGSGYVYFSGSREGPRRPRHDGILVLTAQALHAYSDQDLARRRCDDGSRIDPFGANAADDYENYVRSPDRYRILGLQFDQPDLRGAYAQIAVERESGRPARLLVWAKGSESRVSYCRLSGHQVMDAAGAWRAKVDEIMSAALENFYRRGAAAAKLTDDPAMILQPLAVCARVPSAAVRETVARLRRLFTAPPDSSPTQPASTPSAR